MTGSDRLTHPARLLLALGIGAIALLPAAVAGGGEGAAGAAKSARVSQYTPNMSRVLSARVHHTRLEPVRNTNARRIGRSLAGLRPTWVNGLVRYAKGQFPRHREVRAWREITRIVHTTSPEAKFDVILNAKHYRTGKELLRMMNRVRRKLHPDGWFLDFYSTVFRKRPRMLRSAVGNAHAHGEFLGGNVFGIDRKRPIPLFSDVLGVQDFRFRLDLHAVKRLALRVPVMYHVENDPDRPRGAGCRFIKEYNTAKRLSLIRRRAAQQATFHFRVSYPALFPLCLFNRGPHTRLHTYNAFRDPPMGEAIARLLDRYDH